MSEIQNPKSGFPGSPSVREPGKIENPLILRWLSAAIGIPIVLWLCWIGGAPFSAAILLLAMLGLRELVGAYHRAGIRPNPFLSRAGLIWPAWALLAGPSAISLATARIYTHIPAIIVLFLSAALLVEAWNVWRHGMSLMAKSLGFGLLSGLYISLFGGLGYLREGFAYTAAGTTLEVGAALTFITLFCVWATDSFAFFVGKAWGRRKLAPRISPNKTVEGSVGGLIAALIVGAVAGGLLLGRPLGGLAVGAICGVFGQLGDLFESALKRNIGVKDLGGIIPGHGGILDRFDSLLFAAPLVAFLAPRILVD